MKKATILLMLLLAVVSLTAGCLGTRGNSADAGCAKCPAGTCKCK